MEENVPDNPDGVDSDEDYVLVDPQFGPSLNRIGPTSRAKQSRTYVRLQILSRRTDINMINYHRMIISGCSDYVRARLTTYLATW